jgi:hypothetical protein
MKNQETQSSKINVSLIAFQAFLGLTIWMSFGLMLEGFIGFRVPSYMSFPIRRELFQLAHTHGTLLSLILLTVALSIKCELIFPGKLAIFALRIGSVLMPLGFLFGGIWLIKDEPNATIFLAPLGGLLMIFGIVSALFTINRKIE